MTSTKKRTFFRITVGILGSLALAGFLSHANAETRAAGQVEEISIQEAKSELPREWIWERPVVNLDGMIRNRG